MESYLQEHSIPYQTEGHHHCRPGWLQLDCPFCSGANNWTLGYSIEDGYWNCWRCGFHTTRQVFAELGLPLPTAKFIKRRTGVPVQRETLPEVVFPAGTEELSARHRGYLSSRGFDPDKLAEEWLLKGVGPIGRYKHRILIPVTYQGKVVSYTARDISGKSDYRYLAAPKDCEVRRIKDCLYGLDKAISSTLIVVEGPADVWRLGRGSVATFGTVWTQEQLKLIVAEHYKKVVVVYDNQTDAQRQAKRLSAAIAAHGIESRAVILKGYKDPGELPDEQVKEFWRSIRRV